MTVLSKERVGSFTAFVLAATDSAALERWLKDNQLVVPPETRAWLDHLSTGAPTIHTTPEQARVNLETTIAIERAVASGQSVRLPLQSAD